jgi:hydrogenase maturation protein HypF
MLGTGALLKNTFCLAAGRQAFLGPHIGDLENLETYESFTSAIERFERFVDIRPEVVACDLHPDYMSTAYARTVGVPVVQVQHHHAHVAAVMAEHGLEGPVVGVAYDGTGYGTDGTAWGGEVLLATTSTYERLATFRPIALAGGDVAIREPWRIGLALLLDAFDGVLPGWTGQLLSSVEPRQLTAVTSLIAQQVNVTPARGVGRYFDGFGALFLNRRRAAFEGQVALEWNQAATPDANQLYPFDVNETLDPWEIDLRPTVKTACADALRGAPAGVIAAAFHNTVAAATAAVVRRSLARVGTVPVVATGGCFQNVRLAETVVRMLGDIRVHLHRDVPPGDGGIALGQVVVGNALTA